MIQFSLADISKCLTRDVVEEAFRLKTGSKDGIKCVEVTRASPAGNGLLGAVYRLKVYGATNIATFIAKGMVQDPLLRKTLQTAKYFKREVEFFSRVLPALIDVQRSSGGKEMIQTHVPICYSYHCDGEHDFLLMEDLTDTHCAEISANPTESERDGILNVLAHLHAVSMALHQKRPEAFARIINDIPDTYFSEENREWYAAYYQRAVEIDLKTLADFEDPKTSIYYKKIAELFSRDPYGSIIDLVSDRGENPVISHGDAWSFNFLQSKSRTVAIDFQLIRCTSPLIDVSYFIMLCSKRFPNKKYAMEALKVYHNSLKYYLKDLSIDVDQIYSWEKLITELKKFGKFGILTAATSIPLLCSERCDVLEEFGKKYSGMDKIPLEELWTLTDFKTDDEKSTLINAVRIAVDIGLV